MTHRTTQREPVWRSNCLGRDADVGPTAVGVASGWNDCVVSLLHSRERQLYISLLIGCSGGTVAASVAERSRIKMAAERALSAKDWGEIATAASPSRGSCPGSAFLDSVIDGREVIVKEIAAAPEVRPYIAEQFIILLQARAFLDALPGYLLPDSTSQARFPILLDRIKKFPSDPSARLPHSFRVCGAETEDLMFPRGNVFVLLRRERERHSHH